MAWMNTAEAAAMLHKCQEQVRRYVREGRLRVYRPAGTRKMLFKVEDIESFLKEGFIPSVDDIINNRMTRN